MMISIKGVARGRGACFSSLKPSPPPLSPPPMTLHFVHGSMDSSPVRAPLAAPYFEKSDYAGDCNKHWYVFKMRIKSCFNESHGKRPELHWRLPWKMITPKGGSSYKIWTVRDVARVFKSIAKHYKGSKMLWPITMQQLHMIFGKPMMKNISGDKQGVLPH